MLEIDAEIGIKGLFVSAFISSTVAPGGSEAVLAYLVSQAEIDSTQLLVVATIGNTLGALTTWFLGWLAAIGYPLGRFAGKQQKKSIESVRRWGTVALLFSWLPLIGDGLCLAAGWLRLSFYKSVSAIVVGKAVRYYAVIVAFL